MMQVSSANDVKIYNLSAGKALPDWLEERERRRKAGRKASEGHRRAVQLIQDLEMPVVSTGVQVSGDGRFLAAVGTYKPRVRVYELDQLALKFERCFDSEVAAFAMLADDYSKLVFLHCDRFVEVHAQFGRYYRLRIPHFGRALDYHRQTCDVYFAGDGSNVSRLNLEQGRFLAPLTTDSAANNDVRINPEHQLVAVGGADGVVEAWDPRSRHRAARLDCAACIDPDDLLDVSVTTTPEVTTLAWKDALNLAVGTSTGHVQLYDLRSNRPYVSKDHRYGLPIKSVAFHSTYDHVMSVDAKGVKVWERQTGKPYTAIESDVELNDLAVYKDSGLIFLANEQQRLQAHFLPSLGPAPSWCSFLDNLTEEMEEKDVAEVYDDYKFVTREQLADVGLEHLIGSELLRAYAHGYFMDVRLWRKAQTLTGSSTSVAEQTIRKKLEEARKKRVELQSSMPEVNRDLYAKLKDLEMHGETNKKRRKRRKDREEEAANGGGSAQVNAKSGSESLLRDDRFQALFKDDRFAIDTNEEAYKLLNPALAKLQEAKAKKLAIGEEEDEDMDAAALSDGSMNEDVGGASSSDDFYSGGEDDDSEDEEEERVDKGRAKMPRKNNGRQRKPLPVADAAEDRVYELKDASDRTKKIRRRDQLPLERRLADQDLENGGGRRQTLHDGHQMTFAKKESRRQVQERLKKKAHMAERQAVRRSSKALKNKRKGLS
jgi:ribosome biogenesis protein ENP2